MTAKDIEQQLETATHPVAKAFHKGDHFKVLMIGFRKGMTMKEHVAHSPSKLLVLKGELSFLMAGKTQVLVSLDEIDIPVNIAHSLFAETDSLCLLTQG